MDMLKNIHIFSAATNLLNEEKEFKVGISRSTKSVLIDFNKSPLKMMKNAFYFMLKALFVLEVFSFMS